jgi:hypothetical protein
MFEGEFLEEKKYKGTEKEYDRVGTLIFSGEHKNGNKFYGTEYYKDSIYERTIFEGEFNKKYKGKEYNNNGELIFEGEFRNEERWNGKAYNNLSRFFYVDGKIEGNVMVYDYINHELFEGEYKKAENIKNIF